MEAIENEVSFCKSRHLRSFLAGEWELRSERNAVIWTAMFQRRLSARLKKFVDPRARRKIPPKNGNSGEAEPSIACQDPCMSRHFSRRFGEVSSTREELCGKDAECTFCAALRRAREEEPFDPSPEACSPLTPGVQLVNLSVSDDRQTLRVELDNHWKRMFEQLPSLGEGLVMTRNEAAILGRRMTFPQLAFTTHGKKGASDQGGLWVDFRAVVAARADHLRRGSGHIFGIEFSDAAGQRIHRFTATPSTNLDAFCSWVRLHQGCPAHRNVVPAVERDAPSSGKQAMKRATGGRTIVPILSACRERELRVRATVLTRAVVQRAHFVPQSLQASGDWWFACDDVAGLHFCPPQFTHAKSEMAPNENGPLLLLYSQPAADKPALVLQTGDKTSAPGWSDLLQMMFDGASFSE
jgi:hypothetical protein